MLIAISLSFDTTKFFENCVQVTFLLGPNACAQPLLSRQSRGRTVQDLQKARQFLKQTCLTSDRFVSFNSNLPGLPKTSMVWQPFQLCLVAIFIPRCYHVYMHLYFSLDVFWEALPCNPSANVAAAKELAQLNGKEILRSGHKPRVQPCNSKKIICESSFADVFLFGDSISLFWFHFNHIKKTNIPKPIPEFLGPQLHNSPSPISPTPGNRRTVSTKLPACRRCNAERSLNSNDTVKALEKVDQKTPFWLGKPTGFSNQKNVVLMFLGFKTATVVAF